MGAAGGLMTMEDLASYRTSWEQPVRAALPNTEFTILSAPPPGSGAILAGILGLVERNTFQTELKPAQIRWAATIQVQWIEGLPSPGIASLRRASLLTQGAHSWVTGTMLRVKG